MNNVGHRTLNVDAKTSLRDLHDFAARTGQDSRIRGRTVDGQLQLYAKPDSNRFGMLSKLSPSAIYHRHVAQKALATIFDNHARKTGEPVADILTSNVKTPVGGDLKAGKLNVAAAIAAFRPVKEDQQSDTIPGTVGPTSEILGLNSDGVKSLLSEAAAVILAKGDLTEVTEKLGKLLTKNFDASNPSDQARRDFGTSLGVPERHHMRMALKELTYPGQSPLENALAPLQIVIDGAYDQAAARSSPDSFDGDFKFSLGGVTYETSPTKAPIGQGGSGIVREFRSFDSSPSVAVKIAHPSHDPNQKQYRAQEALKEINLHKRVEGEGHPNVTAMKGAIRLPGGGFAIILEMARFGDLKGFSGKLAAAVEAGVVTKQEALLAQRSAIRDKLQGVVHSHDNGMMNQDVKDENFLVTGDGTIKLADNGGARERDGYDFTSVGTMTAAFVSPEVDRGFEVVKELSEALGERPLPRLDGPLDRAEGVEARVFEDVPQREANPTEAAISGLISKTFPNASDDEHRTLVSDYRAAMKQQILDGQLSPEKRDGYAVGLAAKRLVYTKDMHAAASVMPGETSGYAVDVMALRDLIAKMSDEDVASRVAPRDALKHGAVDLTPDQVAGAKDIIKRVGNWSIAEANKAVPRPLFRTSVSLPDPGPTTPDASPARPASLPPGVDLRAELMAEMNQSWSTTTV